MNDPLENLPEPHSYFMADGIALRLFMLSISSRLAKKDDDPKAWIKNLINELQERVDVLASGGFEEADPINAEVLALLRAKFDQLGADLNQELAQR